MKINTNTSIFYFVFKDIFEHHNIKEICEM